MDVNKMANETDLYSLYYKQTTVTINAPNATASELAEAAKALTGGKDGGAAVYEKDAANKNNPYPIDREKIQAMLAETKKMEERLIETVKKTLGRQTNAYATAYGGDFLSDALNIKNGGLQITKDLMAKVAANADEGTIKWAKEQVSEDGYYGVDKTSDRLVEFAKALTGGDPSKVELMRGAIKKGFEQAEKVWGGKLPEISQKTLEATNKKLDEWAAASSASSITSTDILNQASAGVIAGKK